MIGRCCLVHSYGKTRIYNSFCLYPHTIHNEKPNPFNLLNLDTFKVKKVMMCVQSETMVFFSSPSHPNDARVVTNLGNLIRRQRTFGRPEVVLERVDSIRFADEFRSRCNKKRHAVSSIHIKAQKGAHT